jgi:hypothetical protein
MITHNSFGIFLAEELLGTTITLTETRDSRQFPHVISTRSAAEDLVYARVGSIPPAGNLVARTRLRLWMCGAEVNAALKTRRTNERAAVARNFYGPCPKAKRSALGKNRRIDQIKTSGET